MYAPLPFMGDGANCTHTMIIRRLIRRILLFMGMMAIILLAITIVGSFYMLDISLGDLSGKDLQVRRDQLLQESPDVVAWADSLKDIGMMRDTFMTTADGRRLHANYFFANDSTTRTMVVIHGFTCNIYSSLKIARMFRDSLGLNLFLPDLHGHGESDGDNVQFGWKDADDVLEWMPLVTRLFCEETDARIAVQGVSMGAATAMNLSGKEKMPQIKCYIEDCGYTSVWDELSGELRNRYDLPPFPLMHVSDLICRWRNGWSFKEAAPLKMVGRCNKPMMFIHGDADTFVPSWMVYPLYEAKQGIKTLWVTHGTDHAHSFRDYPKEYENRVREFLESSGV